MVGLGSAAGYALKSRGKVRVRVRMQSPITVQGAFALQFRCAPALLPSSVHRDRQLKLDPSD